MKTLTDRYRPGESVPGHTGPRGIIHGNNCLCTIEPGEQPGLDGAGAPLGPGASRRVHCVSDSIRLKCPVPRRPHHLTVQVRTDLYRYWPFPLDVL